MAAPKIIVKNDNYISGEELETGVDIAVGIGTYFYKGKYGKEALKLVYDNLDQVLADNPVYGQWAFFIHKHGATYVFNGKRSF